MKRKEMINVSSFPFPFLFFSFYRFLLTFQFFSSPPRDSGCFLRFPLRFCAGNLRAAGQNRSPRACPTFDRCVIGASVRFQQRIVRDRNLFQEQTQPETYFNTSVLFNLMFFSCTYFYLFCRELFKRDGKLAREVHNCSVV